MKGRKTIVIARPPEGSDEFARAITALGYASLVEPVLTIELFDTPLPEIGSATPLVFTSANAVRAFAQKSETRANPIFTVGRNTAAEAVRAGFTNVETASGTVDDLADLLSKSTSTTKLPPLYVRGEEISKDLKAILARKGGILEEIVVYRSIPAQNLSINLLKALDNREIEAILFFSARGGKTFAELIEQYDRSSRMRTTKALCISQAVVQSVSVLPFGDTLVAAKPDRYGMIELLERLPAIN